MANTITQFKEGFVPKYQDILHKSLIGRKIASMGLQSSLTWGKKVHRPKVNVSAFAVRDVVRYSDRTMNAFSDSDQYLEIDKQKAVDFQIDDWDKLQTGPLQLGETVGKESALKLKTYIDGDILAETINAAQTFDDGDIAGTAGNGITLAAGSSGNVAKTFTNLLAKLQAYNVENSGMVATLDPYLLAILNQEIFGKELSMTDNTLKNGYSGPILGFETYMSNNLTFTAELAMADQVSEGDTVTIAGVVFTFNATPSGAGSVDIGADAPGSIANLVLAINGGAVGSTYIALSAADRLTLTNLRVEATAATGKITLKATGSGRGVTTAETLTHASNIWSKRMIHCYAGKKGGIDIVLQQDVMPKFREEPKQLTTNVLISALYGKKVFDDGAAKFIDLKFAV